MNLDTLLVRGLTYYARQHALAALGGAVAAMVLAGAFCVGDSMRFTLERSNKARLGRASFAVPTGERLVRDELAREIASAWGANVSPVLAASGSASKADGSARANAVNILGVDASFWSLAPSGAGPLGAGEWVADKVILNERLARQLDVKVGDTVLLRSQKTSRISRDAPLSPDEDDAVALRMNVAAIADDEQFGAFSLQANQVPPYNAFVPLAVLQKTLDAKKSANLLLAGAKAGSDKAKLETLIKERWTLADAQAEIKYFGESETLELRTPRVFLDAPLIKAAMEQRKDARPALTYLVNELRVGDKTTPYSMVTAIGAPIVPEGMADDEILISAWLAEDLAAKQGDSLTITYYVLGSMRGLQEKTATFKVRAVLPKTGPHDDPELMPDFPGLKDTKQCRDWDPGFPMKLDRIRAKDEEYWTEHKGTPKAFVTLKAGQTLWRNRFGDLTAIRFASDKSVDGGKAALEKALSAALNPADFAARIVPVGDMAQAAGAQALDFSQLFIGFSFFILVAGLLLMGLLFALNIERRREETGVLLAVGIPPSSVRKLYLKEGAALGLFAALVGTLLGVGYARAMVHFLSTIWSDAVQTNAIRFHVTPGSLVIGCIAGFACSLFVVWWIARKQAREPIRELLAPGAKLDRASAGSLRSKWVCIISGAGALAMVGAAMRGSEGVSPGLFFGAGALTLIAVLSALAWLGQRAALASSPAVPGTFDLVLRGTVRRRGRSLAAITMLACGSFLVVAVGANRPDLAAGAEKRSSGTGGFAFIGQTALPLLHDLNSKDGRDRYVIEKDELLDTQIVACKLRDGDDASCLNLNRAQQPKVLGVNAEALEKRKAFTFSSHRKTDPYDSNPDREPWEGLKQPLKDGRIPVVVDQNTLQWGMGKAVGSEMELLDENGKPHKALVVGALSTSILQGFVIIGEEAFTKLYPNEPGYRIILVDAPSDKKAQAGAVLSKRLQDMGLELTPTVRKLAEFNAVQDTYLSAFQMLGGLGLLLGSAGLAIILLRNVLERRSELAMMRAIGFRQEQVRSLVLWEHGLLLSAGLAAGTFAALLAVFPALRSSGGGVPWGALAAILAGVALHGALWTWVAASWSLRGPLLNALRDE